MVTEGNTFYHVQFFDPDSGEEINIVLFGQKDEILKNLEKICEIQSDYDEPEQIQAISVDFYFKERARKIMIKEFENDLEGLKLDQEIVENDIKGTNNDEEVVELKKELKSVKAKISRREKKLEQLRKET